jgi:hypothetical protein
MLQHPEAACLGSKTPSMVNEVDMQLIMKAAQLGPIFSLKCGAGTD